MESLFSSLPSMHGLRLPYVGLESLMSDIDFVTSDASSDGGEAKRDFRKEHTLTRDQKTHTLAREHLVLSCELRQTNACDANLDRSQFLKTQES